MIRTFLEFSSDSKCKSYILRLKPQTKPLKIYNISKPLQVIPAILSATHHDVYGTEKEKKIIQSKTWKYNSNDEA